jgi:hypothetical protein
MPGAFLFGEKNSISSPYFYVMLNTLRKQLTAVCKNRNSIPSLFSDINIMATTITTPTNTKSTKVKKTKTKKKAAIK